MGKINVGPVAKSVPFDNSINGFDATNTQAAIEEIGASASPGFTWARTGSLLASSWLLNDGISSNVVGRYVSLTNPSIAQIFTGNENLSTYTLTIYEHDGNSINLTAITTISVSGARGALLENLNIPVTKGKQLAIRLTSGSASNIVAGLILKGSGV